MAYGEKKAGPAKKSAPLADVEESAAGELAALLGVEDVDAFKIALKDYVRACIAASEDSSEET